LSIGPVIGMAGAGAVFAGPAVAGFVFAATAGDGPDAANQIEAKAAAPAITGNQRNLRTLIVPVPPNSGLPYAVTR